MDTSMTVVDAWVKGPNVIAMKSTDLLGDGWTSELTYGCYYSTEMVDRLFESLRRGHQPFFTCRYNEPRDRYVVVDEDDNEVPLSRFGNWVRLG